MNFFLLSQEGQTALHQACNADTVAALTDGGADVNCSDKVNEFKFKGK